jgi:hypothetical protein
MIFDAFSDRDIRSIYVLDFDLLRAFAAVAECGGFRRAPERLHLTQSKGRRNSSSIAALRRVG